MVDSKEANMNLEKEKNKTTKLLDEKLTPLNKPEYQPISEDPATPDYAERHLEGRKTYPAELETNPEFPIPSEAGTFQF